MNPSTSPAVHKALLEASVEGTGFAQPDGETNFEDFGMAILTGASTAGHLIYPEQNLPNGPNHNVVNLTVTVSPAMPAGMSDVLYLKVFDPDHYLQDARDPDGPSAPNDNQKGRTKSDANLHDIGITPLQPSVSISAGAATIPKQLTIMEPQPGNNWIAAVHDQEYILDELGFGVDGTTLFHDPGAHQTPVPSENHTEILTAARTLWLVFVRTVPAELDVQDNSQFLHSTTSQYYQNIAAGVRDAGESAKYYWNVHTIKAYEYSSEYDNDPDSQAWYLGYATPHDGNGSNLVYMETIRDIVNEPQYPDLVQDVASVIVAHEALHRFFGWHGTNQAADEEIMDSSGSAIRQLGTRDLTPLQFRMVQKTLYPK